MRVLRTPSRRQPRVAGIRDHRVRSKISETRELGIQAALTDLVAPRMAADVAVTTPDIWATNSRCNAEVMPK